ncbi:MAG: hypothetical protein IPN69_05800 [Acidobacteria bacterium]|nr:hypothetical protein [Acidobacteriota bacterium]MBK8148719.1 hypothetical protein [Acidobacteriota bacterium]MBK8810233.1 hypothetical protein [Acidobacteriota bacterium]
MITTDEIDELLLSRITSDWRKAAFVVGFAMLDVPAELRTSLDDLYFANRLTSLAGKGMVELSGDPLDVRNCEVRLVR